MKKQVTVLACLLGSWVGCSSGQTFHSTNPLLDIRKTGTPLNLSDEGTSGPITLPFSFQFFGRNFNTVAVNTNGIVSFNENIRPGYWPQVLNKNLDSQYNYTLFPLWTDLVSNNKSPYIRLGTDNVVIGWYDMMEYRNPVRKNSFEVQLWNNNSFEFRYNSVSLSRQPVTIGYSGDLSKYEYKNWFRSYGNNTELKDFSYYYDPLQQCDFNPVYNVSCKNYNAAYLSQQCNLDPLYSTQCSGYSRALLEKNCSTNPQICGRTTAVEATEIVPTALQRATQQNVVASRVTENTRVVVQQEVVVQEQKENPVVLIQNVAPKPTQTTEKQQPLAVNSPQEIVGGPEVSAFQVIPTGFSNYSALVLKDIPFYPVREVYRNQRAIDNRSAQRTLGGAQENRWQELVDIQFRRGD